MDGPRAVTKRGQADTGPAPACERATAAGTPDDEAVTPSGILDPMTESRSLDPEHAGHPGRKLGEQGSAHGRGSSWAIVTIALLACTAGGVSLILQAWVAFYASAAVFALCIPAGALLNIMDDTVAYTTPPPPRRRAN